MASSASTVGPDHPLRVIAKDAKDDTLVKVSNINDPRGIWLRTKSDQTSPDRDKERNVTNETTMRLDPSEGVKDGCVFVFNPEDPGNKTTQGWVKMAHLVRVSPRIVDMSEKFWQMVNADRDFTDKYDKDDEIDELEKTYNTKDHRANLSEEQRTDYGAFKEYVKILLTKADPVGTEVMRPAQGGSRRRKSKISRRRRRRHNSKRNRKNTHTHKRKRRTHRRH